MSPKAPRCAICREAIDPAYTPFCSKRCADVDLNRWLSGVYAIPAVEDDEDPETGGMSGGEPRE